MLSGAVPGTQPRIGPEFGADTGTAIPDGDVDELQRNPPDGGGFPDFLRDPRLPAGRSPGSGELDVRGETGRAGNVAAGPRGDEQGRGKESKHGEAADQATSGRGPGHVRFGPRRVRGNEAQGACPGSAPGGVATEELPSGGFARIPSYLKNLKTLRFS